MLGRRGGVWPGTGGALLVHAVRTLALVALLGAVPTDTMLPCVYEGHLRTDRDWYGFLANVTIMTTGRMTFTFTYPADKCCQNVLFYLEDQMSILNARMNCWQKESLLRPEDDQILRLTPRFSWSGCHMSHPNGVSTYVCEGGRSFTTASGLGAGPTTWYIAVSNCASLMGLELKYRMEIIGHIGECKSPYKVVTTPDYLITPQLSGEPSHAASNTLITDKHCVVEGDLNTTKNWHGFLVNVTLNRGGGFRFRFEYPYSRQIQNVILYSDDDVGKVNPKQSCWQREGIIISRNVPDQILDLSFRSSWNGCVSSNTSSVPQLVCKGERRYNKGRKIYIAVSNCRSRIGLLLKYRLEFFGYTGEPCSGSRLKPQGLTVSLSIGLTVIALLALNSGVR